MSVKPRSKRDMFASLTMPVDKNIPAERELVLGEMKPFGKTANAEKSVELNNQENKQAEKQISVKAENDKSEKAKKSESKIVENEINETVNEFKAEKVDKPVRKEVKKGNSQSSFMQMPSYSHELLWTSQKGSGEEPEKKAKHLPPGKAHFTGNIDENLHRQMKLFSVINKVKLLDVGESGMTLYMELLQLDGLERLVQGEETINEAIRRVVKEQIEKTRR